MSDANTMSFDQQVKAAYDDWIALLEHTGNTDMLKDPYAIWLEAYHVATMLAKHQG
jgi:hypothetical protein